MIDLVEFKDWIAVYKDGDLVYQDHSIEATRLLQILDVEYSSRYIEDWDYAEDIPDKLENYKS